MLNAARIAVYACLTLFFAACGEVGETDVRGNCTRACAAGCAVWSPAGANCNASCDASVTAATAKDCLDQANIYYACLAGTTCSSSTSQCVSQSQAYTTCLNQ